MKKLLTIKSIKPSFDLLPKIPMRMRITSVLLAGFLFQANAETSYSQSARISIEMNNVTVEEVLNEIEAKSEFYFLYNNKLINVDRRVSVDVDAENIESVLQNLFKGTNVVYRIADKQIVLSRKDLAQNTAVNGIQQSKVITGTVVDQNGMPIIGANIVVKGTTNGTITDMDGNFSLEAEKGSILQVSYIGFTDQEIKVGEKNSLSITLKEDSKALDEVVVVGYGTQKKVNLTGAITSVKAETLDNMPTNNLSNALAGRAPGVNVTNTSGFAGASSSIRIRGSFGEPLYVINNIIKSKADFDALDPNEVENISFLKDAASASIYGSKAGNGVVLVTTRSGNKEQKPMFQYKGSFSTSTPTRPLQDYSATDELIWANRVQQTLGREPLYGPEIFDYFKDKSYNVNDYVWQNPSAWQHNLSINGGNDRLQYFMMLGYQDQEGSYKNLEYKRYNFRSDITANITKRFKVNFNLSGNQRNYDRFYWPYDSVDNFDVPDFYRSTFNWTRLYPFYVDDLGNPTTDTNANPVTYGSWNPVEMVLGDRYQKQVMRTIDGQIRFSLDLDDYVKGLKTSILAQYTAYDQNHKAFITHNKGYRFQSASAENPFIPGPVNPDDMVIHNLSSTYEKITESAQLNSSYQFNWFINYDRKFGDHGVSGMLVYEQAGSNGKNLSGSAEDLLTTSIDQIFNTSSDTERRYFNGNEWENARQSLIGRFNYNYSDKYIAEFSFRYDGNYKFAPEERWGFFPSGSLAWRLSEESFLKDNVSWLSNLKLRGSYGSTGDDNHWNGDEIAAFQWRDYYQNGSGYIFGDNLSNGLAIGATPNPYMTWARLEVWDVGFDFGVLDNRLTGEFDYFYKNKNHILGSRIASVPGTFGASLAPENYAEQQWKGTEVSLRWSDNIGDLSYSVYANMGYVRDEWVKWDEAEGLEEWRSKIGRPNDRVQGYICKGIIRTQEELDALPEGFTQFGREPILGTLLYEDIRGANYSEGPDGKIDSNDMTYLSDNGAPRINYGWGFNLEWKGLAIDAHFQGVGAYDRMISTNNGGGVFQVNEKPYFELWTQDVWTPENPDAEYPRVSGQWQEEYGAAGSTYWLRNGAYMRLKNLNIAYTLPREWLSFLGINRVQVFVNGTNLFSIDGMKEHDPEQKTLDSYPLMRTFTGGLSINF